jgi:hypothetical protein
MIRRERVDRKHLYTVKCRTALKPETVQEIATSILVVGKKTQIPVPRDGVRSPSSERHRGNVPGSAQRDDRRISGPGQAPWRALASECDIVSGGALGGQQARKDFRTIPELKRCDINPLILYRRFFATEFLP